MSTPFSAVVGSELAKKALLCASVNPCIRTVLLVGGAGTAKSVLARSIGNVAGKRTINVPSNVSADALFGGMDMDAAVIYGETRCDNGILGSSDDCILCLDNADIMDKNMLCQLLDSVITGNAKIERDGVSSEYCFDSMLVATSLVYMNPHVMDRFDLCVMMDSLNEEDKIEVLRRNASLSDGDEEAMLSFEDSDTHLKEDIEYARKLLKYIKVSDELLSVATELSSKIGAWGLRGDISLIRAAKTIAALDRRDSVSRKDMEEAAVMALAHRRSTPPPEPNQESQEQENSENNTEDLDDNENNMDNDRDNEREDSRNDVNDNYERNDQENSPDLEFSADDVLFEIGPMIRVIDFIGESTRKTTASRNGKRAKAVSKDGSGRYVRSAITSEKAKDIAFDATLRAAAPYQHTRERGKLAISIESQDLRIKIRERRSGCTVFFLVDASSSLGARKRMSAVKGAVLSMLKDSYVKRDNVGMIAFRRKDAELILPPTRSVEYGYKKLESLPTGGRTPLSSALAFAADFMVSYTRTHPGERCVAIAITDGRGNVSMKEGDPNDEALDVAEKINIPGVEWIVVDASTGYVRTGHAVRLAEALRGRYIRLDDLDADRLSTIAKSLSA